MKKIDVNRIFLFSWTIFSVVYVLCKLTSLNSRPTALAISVGATFVVIALLFFQILKVRWLGRRVLALYVVLILLGSIVYFNNGKELVLLQIVFMIGFANCGDSVKRSSPHFKVKGIKASRRYDREIQEEEDVRSQYSFFYRLLRYDIALKIVILLIVETLTAVGVLENSVVRVYSGNLIKQSRGFANPNGFSLYCCSILAEWLCLRIKKMRLIEHVAFCAVGLWLYNLSPGRTSFFSLAGVYLLFIALKLLPGLYKKRFVKVLMSYAPLLMLIISIVLPLLYQNGNLMVISLNRATTNRIAYAAITLKEYGMTLFGTQIPVDSVVLDNTYISYVTYYGMVYLVVLILLYHLLIKFFFETRQYEMVLLTLFYLIMGLGESGGMLNPIYNIPLLMSAEIFRRRRRMHRMSYDGAFVNS